MFLFFPVDAKLDLGRRLTPVGIRCLGTWIHDVTQDLHDICTGTISSANWKKIMEKSVCTFLTITCFYHIIYTFGRTLFHNISDIIDQLIVVQTKLNPPSTHPRLRRIVHLAPPPKKRAAAVSSITCHGGWKMS